MSFSSKTESGALTGFEAPPDHPSLELVVMFNVTDVQRGGFLER
jgi:hypothetical protein